MPDDGFEAMLQRLAARFTPATVIDVGASDGRWSRMARTVWSKAHLMMVEANPLFRNQLSEFCYFDQNTSHAIALAAATHGRANVVFNKVNPYQGVTVIRDDELRVGPSEESEMIPVVRLDDLTAVSAAVSPYLLKLDVHGHEPMIFEGAKEVLAHAGAVVAEVYFWEPATHALRFWELVPLLARYGFRPTDLCEPLYRPSDGRCAQVDMLFERADAPGINKWW